MRQFIVMLALAVACLGGAVRADEDTAEWKVRRVALFKNGLTYVTSETELGGGTSMRLGRLPVPVLGTFWVAYPEDVKVRAVVGGMADVEDEAPVASVLDVLSANIGRQATVHTSGGPVTGTILDVRHPPAPEPQSPYLMGVPMLRSPSGQGVLLMQTEQGIVATNPNAAHRVDILDAKQTCSKTTSAPFLRLELDGPARGRNVNVSQLARGMTWVPSYLIDVSQPEKARFSGKALIVNEVLDLDGVEVELVTGFPNIQFSETNSPIAMTQSLADFINSLSGRTDRGRRGVAVVAQQMALTNTMYFERERHAGASPAYGATQEGQVAEDLFFYPAGRLTLMRGETAMLPLFTAEVPYQHVYTWEIEDQLDEYERYRPDRRDDGPEPAPIVWHVCRVENTMGMPWTTAPAQFVADGRFVGQDVCHYTPAGRKTDVRVNRALNVIAEQAEYEIKRDRNAGHFFGYSYDLVTVRGELKLTNHVGKDVRAEVVKHLSGEVQETSGSPRDVPTAKGLKRVNPRHDLVWEVDLKADDKVELFYVYTVYVRN